jgi:hypothetical protein
VSTRPRASRIPSERISRVSGGKARATPGSLSSTRLFRLSKVPASLGALRWPRDLRERG